MANKAIQRQVTPKKEKPHPQTIQGPIELRPELWDELLGSHAFPPRYYHTWSHVQQMCDLFHQVPVDLWSHPKEVFIAILYHDACYVPCRTDNETNSAKMAQSAIETWKLEVDAEYVVSLIERTAQHGQLQPGDDALGTDNDIALFLDCDMGILGAEPNTFDTYERYIQEEYRPYMENDAAYVKARREFLQGLLQQTVIYLSSWFQERYETVARENIARSLRGLGESSTIIHNDQL